MIRGYYQSPRGYLTRDVPLPELLTIVDRCSLTQPSMLLWYLRRHDYLPGGTTARWPALLKGLPTERAIYGMTRPVKWQTSKSGERRNISIMPWHPVCT